MSQPRSSRNINAVALLKPGVTIDQFQSELSAIAKRLEERYPATNRGFGVQVVPIRRSYVGLRRRSHGRRADDGSWLRAADHVRESRQPDAGPRCVPAARARRARRHGRGASRLVWVIAVGKRLAGGSRDADRV